MRKISLSCAALSLIFGLCSSSRAATYIVDNKSAQAADTNAGTRVAPFKTISAAAKIVAAGDTVLVRPGLYREAVTLTVSGKAGAPIVFKSEVPHAAIIDGADVISQFKTESAGVWSFAAPSILSNPYWDDRSFGEWVYVDGEPLERVMEKAKLAPGSFWEDYDAKRVLVAPAEGAEIKNLKVEFATRDGLMAPAYRNSNTVQSLDDIHIQGFTLQHNADWFGGRTAINFRGQRWLIENNHILWSSWSAISSEGTNHCIVRNNVVDWSGIEAIGGTANSDLLIENNKFLHGNWRRGNPNFTGGVSKWITTIDSVVRGNEAAFNYGYGFWFDIHNVGDIMEGNICRDNLMGGTIFTEISDDIIIRDNVVFNNNVGIIVSESPATLVERNIVFNNGLGIQMRGNYDRENDHKSKGRDLPRQGRRFGRQIEDIPDIKPIRVEQYKAKYRLYWTAPKYFMANNSDLRDNVIFDNNTNYREERNYAIPSAKDAFINNFSDYNIWWNAAPQKNFQHATGDYTDLAQWQKASGRDENSVSANPRESSTQLPDWAVAKRAVWQEKFRTPDEMDALSLGFVESPSAADAMARIRRAANIKQLKFAETGIKAFVFDVDGQKTLALWTTQAGERRAVRLRLNQNAVTFETPYGLKTSRKLPAGTIELVATHLPIYLRGVSEKIEEAPIVEIRARGFNLPDQNVPVTAIFTNEAKTATQIEANLQASAGFKANPAKISRRLAAGEKWTTTVQLVPDGSVRRGAGQLRINAQIGAENAMRTINFSIGESSGNLAFAARPFVIDGNLDDWKTREKETLLGVINEANQIVSGDKSKWSGAADLSAKIYSSWDKNALYVAVSVTDNLTVPAPYGAAPWDSDAVEFFLDGRAPSMQRQGDYGEGVYQIGVSAAAANGDPTVRVLGKTALQGLVAASSRTADGYIIEMKIPLTSANFPAGEWQKGRSVKMSVLLDDKDEIAGPRENILGWNFSADGRNNTDTTGWKTLILSAE